MQSLERFFKNHPLLGAAVTVLVLIIFTQLGAVILGAVHPEIGREYFATVLRLLSGGIVIALMSRLCWLEAGFISTPVHRWGKRWPLAMLPLASLGIVNFFGVEWHTLQFDVATFWFWLIDNASTGVFEETMMRAIAFCILLKAWGNTRAGVYKAAIAQAVIFGLVHLLNLLNGFAVEVVAQVIYATLIGFGFAGAVIYTRSIWPAVLVHGFINAVANINSYFDPNFVNTPTDIATLTGLVAFIFVISILPGHFGIRQYWRETTQSKTA
ncbi:CPBP family intramembrane glutamic endopeptidase [Alteromonas oceanisediminis]|uniref:CPBP family intramembrane glutamic endopeptidase n=1 Tax=Alteromonas oceanisediminis TaxID=2836180 RepID=UPI001BDA6860|nr:CPBP family intramembrane glutamic endopeptidase [Alteromonas oceanisediminis]MBT0584812.1 CPBP family intramembrane metalloprotease [Alteromonas oceanisediminis]